jgi:succinylglutamate desuccinylase
MALRLSCRANAHAKVGHVAMIGGTHGNEFNAIYLANHFSRMTALMKCAAAPIVQNDSAHCEP